MIHVVAAAVTDAQGRVLIAQRPAQAKHLAGGWEFPGGKLEPGETRVEGLARELLEELGITVTGQPRPLIRVRHTYPYGEVLLDMWVVSRYGGVPRGMDGQAVRWCTLEELAAVDLLPADQPIVRVLRLPERLSAVSTPEYQVVDATFPRKRLAGKQHGLVGMFCGDRGEALAAAGGGADFLVLRHGLPELQLAALCEAVSIPVYATEMVLESAWEIGATGVSDIAV